jgi:hypothetical protein
LWLDVMKDTVVSVWQLALTPHYRRPDLGLHLGIPGLQVWRQLLTKGLGLAPALEDPIFGSRSNPASVMGAPVAKDLQSTIRR